ncbi:transporter substrate-binding domain-containing protein [Thiomicrorhabdus aquaedulcis]|uniref:transporter substrate-binding domain-containing protein n=1 Tax=Thiomicrorhabdus aquaedulcis TaxID=2211106 RepID=UPI001E494E0C|nr:transporter substrate-binding domain-containing protein [Thiomicrorhabdus aquaedulcis]
MKAYEHYLNRGPKKQRYQTHVVFLAHPFEVLITELKAGRGDVIAAGLTVTPEIQTLITYTEPYIENINKVLVAHQNQPQLKRLEDLSGRQVVVVSNSNHIIHLEKFNQGLGQLGLEPMEIIQADPFLETEDLLEMLGTGLFDLTVADSHIAQIYQQTLPNIRVESEFIFHHGGKLAWAINPKLPELQASLNDFITQYARPGQPLHNTLYNRYFENPFG